jgi:RHS repeat-associated protein
VSGGRDQAPETFEHDPQGNVTSMPGLRLLRWDPEDRLRLTAHNFATPGRDDPGPEAVVAAYDQTGSRVRKAVDRARDDGTRQVVRERVYLGPFEQYREYDSEGAVTLERTTLHVFDEDHRAALVETRTRGTDQGTARLIRHQLTDHLGSSVVELDQQARLISYEEYYSYGSSAYQAMASVTEVPKRYRYTGRERDAESGLSYHGARYYAPWLGRWTSPDPAGTSEALSPYVYVGGNPLRLVDPGGRQGSLPVNSVEDLLHFIRSQAGFEAGAGRALNFTRGAASPFGTAAHQAATDVVAAMKAARIPGAERIYSEVRVVAGRIVQIAGKPGGPAGAHNLDLVVVRQGQTLRTGEQLTSQAAEVIADLKYGGGTISSKHGVYGVDLLTVNGKTAASASTAATGAASAPGTAFASEASFADVGRELGLAQTTGAQAPVPPLRQRRWRRSPRPQSRRGLRSRSRPAPSPGSPAVPAGC